MTDNLVRSLVAEVTCKWSRGCYSPVPGLELRLGSEAFEKKCQKWVRRGIPGGDTYLY
jgi:hypothetical protein